MDGLHPYVVNRLRQAYSFHTLAAEDVLRTSQRPKLEAFDDHIFVVARMLSLLTASFGRNKRASFCSRIP